MKTFITLIFIFISAACYPQSPTGTWLSKDSTRTYKITQENNGLSVQLAASKRKEEKTGITIIEELGATKKKNIYKGALFAVADGTPVNCKAILLKDGNLLRLKLRRMFFFPVNIYWHRAT